MKELSPRVVRQRDLPADDEPILIEDYVEVEESGWDLQKYLLFLRSHLPLIAACAAASVLIMGLYVYTRVPMYTAETTLLLERKPPQVLKIQDSVSASIEQADFIRTQYEILKSRALASRVIREVGLNTNSPSGGRGDSSKQGLISTLGGHILSLPALLTPEAPALSVPGRYSQEDPRSPMVDSYLSMLQVKPVSGTSLVRIALSTPDPTLSAQLANAHAAGYVRYGLDLRSSANEEALVFLQKKLVELKERLEQSEAALNSYRRDKGIISLDNSENIVVHRLADLNQRLTEAEAERIAREAQVRAVRNYSVSGLPAVVNSPVVQTLKGEIARLETEYMQLAREFKPGYPRLENLRLQLERLRGRLAGEIESHAKSVEAAYAAARATEEEFRARMEEQKKATLSLKDSAVGYAILAREVDANRQLYDGVLQRMREMGVAADVRNSNAYVVDPAERPGVASYPNKKRSLLLGLLMGLFGGVGLAFVLERLDNTFKDPDEVSRYLLLPSLGVVPDFTRLGHRRGGYLSKVTAPFRPERPPEHSRELVIAHHSLSSTTEAYRMLRSSILLSRAGEAPRTILVTSAISGEGKTVTAVNSAIVFAQMGGRVLIVDGDLRLPRCHMLLKVENVAGLTEVLAGQIELEQAIRPTEVEGVSFIPAGLVPPNPAELVGSTKMQETLTALRESYDFILVDSSPVLAVSDPVLLSTMVDGVLLVVNGQRTSKQLVRKVRSRLSNPRSKILGVVLNRVDTRNGAYAYYGDYYSYYYRDGEPPEKSSAAL